MELLTPAQIEVVSPIITVECHIGRVSLTWFNTRLRLFVDPHEQFNHVEFFVVGEDGTDLHATQNTPLMDLLFENDYPVLSMPYVDVHTEDWLASLEIVDLDTVTPEDFS